MRGTSDRPSVYVVGRILEDHIKALSRSSVWVVLLAATVLGLGAYMGLAQGGGPPDKPAVTVRGQTYTPRSILAPAPSKTVAEWISTGCPG